MPAAVHIGTSGYVYKHWKGVFYPEKLPTGQWLEFYCRHFRTVELNNSFYRLPTREMFENWKNSTPDQFIFSVKMNRYVTHIKRMKEAEAALDNFSGNAEGLVPKLGPILFQFPPNLKVDIERLRHLLSLRRPSDRWVFEFRNKGWFADEVLDSLRADGAAFCVHDNTKGCPTAATADFAYLRLHGGETHDGNYTGKVLRRWAWQVGRWLDDGIDVFVYFNNDIKGYAVSNARELIELVGSAAVPA